MDGQRKTKKSYSEIRGIRREYRSSHVPNKISRMLADADMVDNTHRPSYRVCRRDRHQTLSKQRDMVRGWQ